MQTLLVLVDRVDRRYLPLVPDGVVLPPGLTVDYLAWTSLTLGGLTAAGGQDTTQDAVGGGGSTGECIAQDTSTAAPVWAAATWCCWCCCWCGGHLVAAAGAEGEGIRIQGGPLPGGGGGEETKGKHGVCGSEGLSSLLYSMLPH
jgi:hypothetical protein